MAITAEARSNIIKLVVGMFGAAPGANILSQLVAVYEGGATLQQIAAGLATKSQFTQIYPTFLTNEEFAARLADNLLGDEVSAGTKATAETWVEGRLNAGVSRGLVIAEAITLINAAPTTGAFANARAAFENKVEVATHYSVTAELSDDNLEDLQAVIAEVTSDDATVEAAKAEIDEDAGSASGESFTLTDDIEETEGTGGNDTFKGTLNGADSTIQTGDVVTGGNGTDRLDITVVAASAPLLEMTEVESVYVRQLVAQAIDAALWEDVAAIWSDNSQAATVVNNVGNAVTVGVSDSDEDITVNYVNDALDSDEATQAIAVNDADDVTITVAGGGADAITALAVTAEGDSKVTFASALAALEAITVAGAGSVELVEGAAFDALATFDASENSGGVTVVFDAGTVALESIMGGSGDDDITITAAMVAESEIDLGAGDDRLIAGAGDLDDVDSVDGGDGDDTITLDALSLALADKFSNFEIADLAGADGTIDVGLFENNTFSSLAVTADLAGNTTVSNLAGTEVVFDVDSDTTKDINARLASSSGTADTATINFDEDSDGYVVANFDTSGLETITINSNGEGGAVLNQITDLESFTDTVTSITITGDTDFALVGYEFTGTDPTTSTTSKMTLIDASAATGDITIGGTGLIGLTDGNLSFKGMTVKTGTGDDTIEVMASSAVIESGAGEDEINTGNTSQTIRVGADEDADVVVVDLEADFAGAYTSLSGITTIANLADGDTIDVTALSATIADVTDFTEDAKDFNSLVDAINGALAVVDDEVVAFEWVDGNTYLVIDGGTEGVIKLIGQDYDMDAAAGIITIG